MHRDFLTLWCLIVGGCFGMMVRWARRITALGRKAAFAVAQSQWLFLVVTL